LGYFITFEGIEGSGKTTQMEMLRDHLEWKEKKVVAVREPGGTVLGERIRAILLNIEREKDSPDEEEVEAEGLDPLAELFLYEACRAQLIVHVIRPALNEDKIVICDRFIDSTVTYQSFGRGLDIKGVRPLNKWACRGVVPDVTFVIDCTPEVGLKRALTRIAANETGPREDRFEREDIEFHTRIRDGYLYLAKQEPARIKLVNGERDIDVIHKEICDIIEKSI
jgi:dTMP kinase